jgi:hypothetical protein
VRPDVQKGFLIWNLIPKHSHRTKVDVASSPLGVRPLLLSINSLPQEDKRSHTTSKLSLDTTQPRQLKAKPQKHPEIEQASPSPSILVLGDNEMTSSSLFIPVHSQFLPKGRTTPAGFSPQAGTTSTSHIYIPSTPPGCRVFTGELYPGLEPVYLCAPCCYPIESWVQTPHLHTNL